MYNGLIQLHTSGSRGFPERLAAANKICHCGFILDVGLGGGGAVLVLGIRSLIIASKMVKVPELGGGRMCFSTVS